MNDGKGWMEKDFGIIGKWWPINKIEGYGGLSSVGGTGE